MVKSWKILLEYRLSGQNSCKQIKPEVTLIVQSVKFKMENNYSEKRIVGESDQDQRAREKYMICKQICSKFVPINHCDISVPAQGLF